MRLRSLPAVPEPRSYQSCVLYGRFDAYSESFVKWSCWMLYSPVMSNVMDRADVLFELQEVVERVGEVLLVELTRLRRLPLVAAVGAEVRAGTVRPRIVVAAVGELREVGTEVHAVGQPVRDLILGVRRAEDAVRRCC